MKVSPVDQAIVMKQSAYMLFYANEGSGWFETFASVKQKHEACWLRVVQEKLDGIKYKQKLLRNKLDKLDVHARN